MRITINGDYDDARIQRSVPLNLWNAAKGCSKGRDRASVALNTYIAELHARALEKHKELVLEQALITPKLILKRVFGKDTGMRTLLGTMQEGIAEEKAYRKIPVINEFKDKDGNDIMMQQIQRNYDRIKLDAQAIINEEMNRIKSDPELCKRLGLDDEKSSKKKE